VTSFIITCAAVVLFFSLYYIFQRIVSKVNWDIGTAEKQKKVFSKFQY
jgi:hypothetical protein